MPLSNQITLTVFTGQTSWVTQILNKSLFARGYWSFDKRFSGISENKNSTFTAQLYGGLIATWKNEQQQVQTDWDVFGCAKDEVDEDRVERWVKAKYWRNSC